MLNDFRARYSSDLILHRFGFDGKEPKELRWLYSKYAKIGLRSAFSINTYYEEIHGGYYINRSLFILLYSAIREIGLFPVIFDVYREDGLVPIEGEGQFVVPELYALITEKQELKGILQVWQYQVGGGGEFYGNNVVFDMILPDELMEKEVVAVKNRCISDNVCFKQL